MTDRDLSRPWPALLREWSRLWLSPDAHEELERRFPPEAHATGWLRDLDPGLAEFWSNH